MLTISIFTLTITASERESTRVMPFSYMCFRQVSIETQHCVQEFYHNQGHFNSRVVLLSVTKQKTGYIVTYEAIKSIKKINHVRVIMYTF